MWDRRRCPWLRKAAGATVAREGALRVGATRSSGSNWIDDGPCAASTLNALRWRRPSPQSRPSTPTLWGRWQAAAMHSFAQARVGHRLRLAARRVVLGNDEIEGRQNLAQVRARKWHRLHRRPVKRAVWTHDEHAGLVEQGRLLDAG
jgi:hypothetical protein